MPHASAAYRRCSACDPDLSSDPAQKAPIVTSWRHCRRRATQEQVYRGRVVLYYPEKRPGRYPAPDFPGGSRRSRIEQTCSPAWNCFNEHWPRPWSSTRSLTLNSAEAQVALGRSDEARKNYRRALDLDPAFSRRKTTWGTHFLARARSMGRSSPLGALSSSIRASRPFIPIRDSPC